MKKKLFSLFKARTIALLCIIGFLSVGQSTVAQTLFSDYYNRDVLSPGGTPNVTYTTTLGTTGAAAPAASATAPATINDINGENDYRLKIGGGASIGTEMLMTSLGSVPGYNSVLSQNSQPITWSFNIRHNRNTATLSGFSSGKYGVAAIIACDNANPMDLTAKGYALVMGNVGGVAGSTYDLVSFTGGIMDAGTPAVATTTLIISGMPLAGTRDVASVQITYNPSSNSWSMLQKDDAAPATGVTAVYPDPAFAATVCGTGTVTDTAGFVSSALPNFGYILNHGATAVNLYIDHVKIAKGSGTSSVYFLAANSDCSNLLNWGVNQDGSGAHPGNFTADNQTFKIHNTGAIIGSDWTVTGSGSSVVFGNGTLANSLNIPASVAFTAVLNISANTNLTVSSLTSNFTINTIDTNSTVSFDGSDSQNIPGATYGNLNILTQGTNGANATGTISVVGTFNIPSGTILNMGSSKLAAVNMLMGTGTLKTKNPNSTALPAGINWPFDIYYNYTSANNTQTIALGTYNNLDITGGPRKLSADISISGAFTTGLGIMTATNRITMNGTAAQTIQSNFPNPTALIINNNSAVGVTLSAQEIIPDATNLELAGNLSADFNENIGTLSLVDNSIIKLGATDHSIVFTSSSASPGVADFWMPGKTLTIKGWTGTPLASGTAGKIFVGTDATGLTANQLAQISFEGFQGASILATGEVVPTSFLSATTNEFEMFRYAPNPVTDKLTISNINAIEMVNVYNLLGQKVISVTPNQLQSTIDMSSLVSSVYFVEVISQSKKSTVRVIKQ